MRTGGRNAVKGNLDKIVGASPALLHAGIREKGELVMRRERQ
jgi:hypothetical protein